MDEITPKKKLEKILEVLKSWKGPKPDYDDLDFSRYHQTEEAYQEEQRKWIESRRKKKRKKTERE